VKAGNLPNHSETGVKVQTAVKAGGVNQQHAETAVKPAGLKVQTVVRAGGLANHSETAVAVRTGVKAGGVSGGNHAETMGR